jgi:hypothetical protein
MSIHLFIMYSLLHWIQSGEREGMVSFPLPQGSPDYRSHCHYSTDFLTAPEKHCKLLSLHQLLKKKSFPFTSGGRCSSCIESTFTLPHSQPAHSLGTWPGDHHPSKPAADLWPLPSGSPQGLHLRVLTQEIARRSQCSCTKRA